MLRSRIRTGLGVAALCAVLAAAPATAAAALNLNGFATTFPKAAALCTKASKNKLGKKLQPSKAKVLKACKTLQQHYSDTATALEATLVPLRQQGRDIVTQERQACQDARRARNPAACREAQRDAREKLRAVRQQIGAAYKNATAAYESARKAFWAAIKRLKGAGAIKPDAPVGAPTTTTDVPDDSSLAS